MIHYNSLYMCLPFQISERTFHFPLACLTKITPISIVHFSNNLFHSFEINSFIFPNNQFHNDTLEFHVPWLLFHNSEPTFHFSLACFIKNIFQLYIYQINYFSLLCFTILNNQFHNDTL